MGENKQIKVRLETIIYIFIIILLIIALGIIYYLGFIKNKEEIAKLQNEATLKFQLEKVNWCIIYILPVYVTKYIWELIIYKWKQTIGFFKRY